jgi:hypothetical protein
MSVTYNETFKGYRTAKELLIAKPELLNKDGIYPLCPDGTLNSLTRVYCDMTTDGGGWMLVARSNQHGSVALGKWGWLGTGTGELEDFSQPYQESWYTKWHLNSNTFTEFIFGNRLNVYNNKWGPFIYKHTINYTNLFTVDGVVLPSSRTVLKFDLSVYNTSEFPVMHQYTGYSLSALSDNSFYLRDSPGIGYGGYPNFMRTTYVNHTNSWHISGPWGVTGTTVSTSLTRGYDSNGDYIQKSGDTNYGGVSQYMIMVR